MLIYPDFCLNGECTAGVAQIIPRPWHARTAPAAQPADGRRIIVVWQRTEKRLLTIVRAC